MLTINLEKSLIRENRKLVMPKELLLIDEYDKFTSLVENDALSRVGLNKTLKEGAIQRKRNHRLFRVNGTWNLFCCLVNK